MSFETFPCGSPEAESTEEPAPSLYVETPEDDPSSLLIKKPVMNTEPSRLAETANIEDQMMSEDEIAQVNAKSGDALKLNMRKDYQETEASHLGKKNVDDAGRRAMEGNNVYEVARPHWIQLNYGNSSSVPTHATTPNDRQQQESDRASVIIKRLNNKEQQEVDSDSDNDSQDSGKIRGSELRCNEKISDGNDENVNAVQPHSSRALYYNYNAHHEDVNKLEDKGNAKLQNARGEILRNVHGETKALPVYYMPAGAYPHMVAMASGNAGNSANVLKREHFVHTGINELKGFPVQHMDYVSGRPEQQVPVATSTVNPGEGNVYGNLQHGAPGLQFMDRRFVHAGGYAMVPGLGHVRLIDGMYYQGLSVGGDQGRYENFAAVPSFVPLNNIPSDISASQSQSQLPSSAASNTDVVNQRGQDKLLNAAKPYVSPVHSAVSPVSSLEERRSTNSPAVKSDSSSPAPGEDPDSKKLAQSKLKGKPKPTTGASKPEIKCEQCGKTFTSSSALAKHKLTHSDERRYVCSTCGKGFKRQDHLNGHMVTHRDKKPYECRFADCDKSYCDMRSLRRHLENHHPANGNNVNDSRPPGSGSPSLNCNDKLSPAGSNEQVGSPRNLTKLTKVRTVKDRNEHLQVSGYDSGRSSGRSTPGSTHEPSAPRERPVDLPLEGAALNSLRERERNSDSFSSTTSEDGLGNSAEQSVPEKAADAALTHSAVDLLKQAADRVKGQNSSRNVNEGWSDRLPQQSYVVYRPEGTLHPQWYQTALYAQDPRLMYPSMYHFPPTVFQVPVSSQQVSGLVNESCQRMVNDVDTPTEMTKTVGVSTQATPSPSQDYRPADAMQVAYYKQQQGGRHAETPTDPTAVAVATAKEMGQFRYTGESFYGVHPSGTQWQQVRYDETANTYNSASSMGNSKSLYGHAMTPESNGSASIDNDLNHVETLPRGTEFRNSKNDDGQPAEKRQRLSEVGIGERRDANGPSIVHIKLEDNNNAQDKGNQAVFRNPAEIVTPRRKQRPRPEPLTIPPSASTTYFPNRPGSPMNRSQPCSPPYTPPPMLSPRSIYHVPSLGNLTPRLSASLQHPLTPSRLLLSGHRSSFDGEEASQFPEPKINVGPQFQAEVPPLAGPKEGAIHDVHRATLCWKPLDEKKRTRREEIESFLDMACSVAIVGGGSNKEYALHILHKANGNIKEAVKLLLCQNFITQNDDPMYDYHYEGSVRWASKERQIFRQNFRTKGKEFSDLQKDIGGKKTIFDCIEFYYHWKAAHPEAVRGRTRYIDSDSEDYEDTGSETNSNPSYFECDFPQCNAKFVSRQALNGHIRVHGGSFMKPSEPNRRKNRNTAGSSASNGTNSAPVVRKRKSPSPAPASVHPDLNNPDGQLPEFACKVCGRIFHKIKSRSAHMKTHVKRPDDDEKLSSKLPSKNH